MVSTHKLVTKLEKPMVKGSLTKEKMANRTPVMGQPTQETLAKRTQLWGNQPKKGHGKGTVGVSAKKIVMNRVCFEQIC